MVGEYLLRVEVLAGRGLAPKDPNNLSDPYVIVGPADASGKFVDKNPQKSEVRYFTLNPTWEKALFCFDAEVKQVRVEVWDADKDKGHDFMGYFVLKTDFDSLKSEDIWVKLLPRTPAEEVCGEIHVVASRGYSSTVHPSVLFNQKNNMVRIFFSSTFVDMAEEREVIMRKVMVELRKFCYDRGVSLTYIDMRWGITKEMGDNGQTIIRCLQEVDHSRPYFVGTIAQRYGWHQEKDGTDKALSDTFNKAEQEYPWLNDYRTRSVTELEILHGFLLHPALPKGHTLFYFRDPQYLQSVDAATKSRFEDVTPYAVSNLNKLKNEITKKAQTGDCIVQKYTKPTDLEEMMLKDLKTAIERDFPMRVTATLCKYFHEHENFAQSLCSGYVPKKSYFDALGRVITSNGAYLLVSGEIGSGKSALLANWWSQQRSNPKVFFFVHFVGASSLASNFHGLIIRLFDTINSKLQVHERLPIPRGEELVATIPKFLYAISMRGGITIVIDSVNQLPEQYHDLLWLPRVLPQKVNVILSSLPCKITEVAEKRKWDQLAVVPLQAPEKELLIKSKLELFGKVITDANLKLLAEHPLSATPLFLSTALSELCIIGYFSQFESQLKSILDCTSLSGLFQQVLNRLEENFGTELTMEVMQLIAVSRQGLLEATAQTTTGATPITLFPLLSATRNFFVINRGKLTFSHDHLRKAVHERYVAASRIVAQRKLIEYWKTSPFDSNTAYELPWLLAELLMSSENEAADVQKDLAELLLNLENFKILFAKPELQLDLHKYWRALEAADSKWKMGALYAKEVSKANLEQGFIVINVSKFLLQASLLPSALEVAEKALEIFQKSQPPKRSDIADAMNNLGDIFCELGELEKAADKLNEAYKLRVQQFGEFHPTVAQSLGSIGLLRFQQGEHLEALESFEKALEILKKGKNQRETAKTLHNIAAIYQEQENYAEALKVLEEALDTLKSVLGELHPEVATAISNLAILLHANGDNADSKKLHRQALDMRIALFGNDHLDVAHSLYSYGEFLFETEETSLGISFVTLSIGVQLKLLGPTHPQLGDTLTTLANMNYDAEMVSDAVRYAMEALAIRVEQHEKEEEEIKELLGIIAGGLSKLDKPEEARRFNISAFNKAEFKDNFCSTL